MLTLPVFWDELPAFIPKNESRQPENIHSNPLQKLTQTGSKTGFANGDLRMAICGIRKSPFVNRKSIE
jgi:hypothetical protein